MTARWFGPENDAALRDFFVVFEKHVQMADVLRTTARNDPSFEGVAQGMMTGFIGDAALEKRRVLRAAIEGDWGPYETALSRDGELYADHGIVGWHVMVRGVARTVSPQLVAAYENEPRRLSAALLVMHEFLDRVHSVLSRAYLARRATLLREVEQRWRRMIDSAMVGVWVFDAAGKSTFMNDRMGQILGVDPIAGLAIPVSDFVEPAEHHVLAERLAARRAGRAGSYEQRFHRQNGTIGWLAMESSPLHREDGTFEGIITMCTDITDRKLAEERRVRLEEQLRQAQKMEAVGRLAGGVAHDFNNLLSVVLSYTDLILSKLPAQDPLRQDLVEIRNGGERAADLTRQLLMFSRQQVLEPKTLDLSALLGNVDKMLRRIVGEDVELITHASAKMPVRVDPGSIEQVIVNLVVNARDAMPHGGKLTMETADVELDAEFARAHVGVTPGPHVLLSVSDTGVGMDKATAARVFEPFFTTKDKARGTGLGLSTVYGIVEQSGGTVWLETALGKGTTFRIYLPRGNTSAALTIPKRVAPASFGGTETVLLVEDQDQLRTVAERILSKQGYNVLSARCGSDALALAEAFRDPIHLLLTDVVMPAMSGPVLAGHLTALRPAMKVLCMSGYTDDSVVQTGLLSERMAFLPKPITADSLTRKVREVLDAPSAARP